MVTFSRLSKDQQAVNGELTNWRRTTSDKPTTARTHHQAEVWDR